MWSKFNESLMLVPGKDWLNPDPTIEKEKIRIRPSWKKNISKKLNESLMSDPGQDWQYPDPIREKNLIRIRPSIKKKNILLYKFDQNWMKVWCWIRAKTGSIRIQSVRKTESGSDYQDFDQYLFFFILFRIQIWVYIRFASNKNIQILISNPIE